MQKRSIAAAVVLGASVFGCGGDDTASSNNPALQQPGPTMPVVTPTPGPVEPVQPPAVTPTPTPVPAAPQPVMCGAVTCSPPSNPLGAFAGAAGGLLPSPVACCLDQAAGTCGVAMSAGGACAALATPDTRCPSIDLGMFAALAGNLGFGCCTDMNQCGIDGALFGMGCVENSQAQTMLAGGGLGTFLMLPPARACDAPPEVTVDAGMDMGLDAGMTDDAGL